MNRKRLAELKELLESTDEPNDRADQEMILEVECPRSGISPQDDFAHRQAWLQYLTALVQMPDAAD